MGKLFDNLNVQQKEALKFSEGPLLILAGAGSGKTKVLTSKIAYLIEEKAVKPENILAITFTNKAAFEMKERILKLCMKDVEKLWMGTFHSICVKILRRNINKIGYENNFTIYDTDDQKTLIKSIFKEEKIDDGEIKPSMVLSMISKLKNKNTDPKDMDLGYRPDFMKKIQRIYEIYEKKKKEFNSLDFDDLIIKTNELLSTEKDVLEFYQDKFKYIFVDEYQDTNIQQYYLIKMIAMKNKNICAVGDSDQSIYAWRGADINNIIKFEKDFNPVKTILLEQNYRSSQNILDKANLLISNNTNRKKKNLWTEKDRGEDVVYTEFYNEYDEAKFAVETVKQLLDEYSLDEMAILYRTNNQSRNFEEAIVTAGLKYRLVGGIKFYERKEIKDVLAYLKMLVNKDDNISLLRIINSPKRGIGNTTIEKLLNISNEENISIFDIINDEKYLSEFKEGTRKKLENFSEISNDLKNDIDKMTISDFVKKVLEDFSYISKMQEGSEIENKTRLENISDFIYSIELFEKEQENVTISDYLSTVSLFTDTDKTEESKGINLMTIHASKGLEFKVVFIVGMEEDLFPSMRSVSENEFGLEEERRLCYVAVTRAKEKVYFSSCKSRNYFGKKVDMRKSRFLKEMDLITEKDFKSNNESSFRESYSSSVTEMKNSLRYSIFERKKNLERKNEADFKVGDKIEHKSWGKGIIISIKDNQVVINFDLKGIKKLDINLAPIKRDE